MPSLAAHYQTMLEAVLETGKVLAHDLMHQERAVAAYKDGQPIGVQTAHDVKAEAIISRILAGAHPGYGILGEEGGRKDAVQDADGVRHYFYLDPVDGTKNLMNPALERPFCITIGLVREQANGDKHGIGGVVYALHPGMLRPLEGTLYLTDGQSLHAAPCAPHADAALPETWTVIASPQSGARRTMDADSKNRWVFHEILGHGMLKIPTLKAVAEGAMADLIACENAGPPFRLSQSNSGVMDMIHAACMLACGGQAAVYLPIYQAWDVAATLPMLEAAGAVTAFYDPSSRRMALSRNHTRALDWVGYDREPVPLVAGTESMVQALCALINARLEAA